MPDLPPPSPRPGYPPSPCNRICTLDTDDVCIGCRRTVGEIMRWASMSADQQWALVRDLEKRPDRL